MWMMSCGTSALACDDSDSTPAGSGKCGFAVCACAAGDASVSATGTAAARASDSASAVFLVIVGLLVRGRARGSRVRDADVPRDEKTAVGQIGRQRLLRPRERAASSVAVRVLTGFDVWLVRACCVRLLRAPTSSAFR